MDLYTLFVQLNTEMVKDWDLKIKNLFNNYRVFHSFKISSYTFHINLKMLQYNIYVALFFCLKIPTATSTGFSYIAFSSYEYCTLVGDSGGAEVMFVCLVDEWMIFWMWSVPMR